MTDIKVESKDGTMTEETSAKDVTKPHIKDEQDKPKPKDDQHPMTPKEPFTDALWKKDVGRSRLKHVEEMEKAARCGLASLNQLIATMNRHVEMNPSAKGRIERIKNIITRKKEFQVLVGFLGSTGSGKTTIVNALLGIRDLLPSTTGRACTAVVVEVSYNNSNKPESKFRAEVVYISEEDWQAEIEQIFEDLKEANANSDEDEAEADSETSERIEQTFDKIKAVYPHIKSHEDLQATTVENLLNHEPVNGLLGSTRFITSPSKNRFSDNIKEYVDSGNSQKKVIAHWPLVKLVKVFVKSHILKDGITLVDLPGNSDSNAARSKVATSYLQKLSVTCIVGTAIRGIDEKNAHDLLEKITKRHLQMDGLYNQESLCFILSQTDRDFDKHKYIRDNPELSATTYEDRQAVSSDQRLRKELEAEVKSLKTKINKSNKEIKQLSDAIRDIIKPPAPGQKRKRAMKPKEVEESLSQVETLPLGLQQSFKDLHNKLSIARRDKESTDSKVNSLHRRKFHLELAEFHKMSRVAAKCIEHRNTLSSEAIRRDFNKTLQEMGKLQTDSLEVFPVSADLYTIYLRDRDSKIHGFQTLQDTGVPPLRDWLVGTTITTRGKYAQAFLKEVEHVVAWMRPWVNDKFADTKMSCETRDQWEPEIDAALDALSKKLNKLGAKTLENMQQILKINLYSTMQKAERKASKKAIQTARSWSKLHWSTHRCANRAHGHYRDGKRNEHKWNEELVHDMTDELLPSWNSIFEDILPTVLSSFANEARVVITELADLMRTNPYNAEIYDALDIVQDNILGTQDIHEHESSEVFEEIKKAMQVSHRLAEPAIREFLEPMYEKCAYESGKGHFQRNKSTHESTFKKSGEKMHHTGNKAIKKGLREQLDTVMPKLEECNNIIVRQIRDETEQFFEQNTRERGRLCNSRVPPPEKRMLSADLVKDIQNLASSWATNIPVSEQPEDDASEDEMEIDRGRFINLEKIRAGAEEDEDYTDSEEEN